MSKTLDDIKDEYAREKGFEAVAYTHAFADMMRHRMERHDRQQLEEDFDTVATRFAAEQTAQMKADILDARRFMQAYIDICEADKIKHLSGDNVRGVKNFLEKTAHYDI